MKDGRIVKIESKISDKKHFSLSAIIILSTIVLCVVFMFSPLQIYFRNQIELNTLKSNIEAAKNQKLELNDELKRWDDKNFVVAKARERLGFVFPGEVPVSVIEDKPAKKQTSKSSQIVNTDVWYKQIGDSFSLIQTLP
ncbi:MAG: septum formation initiator family protein [Bifidobacteriaceae bacterium]|jgi:cell division protein FtsB|nr:septum formation initiator family protein [Bifidobacteriaceae bacterium]